MDLLLILAKIALVTEDERLRKDLKKVFDYIDRKGCRIATEVTDNSILVYDASNAEYLLAINVNINDKKIKKMI